MGLNKNGSYALKKKEGKNNEETHYLSKEKCKQLVDI